MKLSAWQRVAIENPTVIPEEQARPIFGHFLPAGSVVLTVRRGYG